jgi:methylsterol monooxygenase
MGTITGPLICCLLISRVHMFTTYTWVTLRLFQAIDAHSGYGKKPIIVPLPQPSTDSSQPLSTDFSWSLRHFIPFWPGVNHHDFHRMSFTNNYATSFRWWDRIFGTDDKYRAYKAHLAAAKKQKKSASEEKELERKMLEEVEKEGLRAEKEVVQGIKAKRL